jgi:hypothetical protein
VSRVRFAAIILEPLNLRSILDIGCRDCELASYFPGLEYHGADLFPGPGVSYVGNICDTALERAFDAVVACDILEHLEDPSGLFDRLLAHAERYFLISLPNCYDLKSRAQFLGGQMGGKYRFTEEPPIDRHHWLMNRAEIAEFCRVKAEKHALGLRMIDMPYGRGSSRYAGFGRLASAVLPRSLGVPTVFALFTR